MPEYPEAWQKFQDGLKPYIKPREQANYIRRILALHLASQSHDGPLSRPLALAEASDQSHEASRDTKGLYKQYTEALRANTEARRQFTEAVQARPKTPELYTSEQDDFDPLEQHLANLRLQKKRQRLSAVRKYLDQLIDQPAAAPGFLDADNIFNGAPSLPNVPKEIVNSLVVENSNSAPDLTTQTNQLEKIVLRAKLQLRQEAKLLEEAKVRAQSRSDIVSNGVRLEALSTTRAELVNWIESELGRVSGDESMVDDDDPQSSGNTEADQATIEAELKRVNRKYAQYLQSRKDLLVLLSTRPQTAAIPDLSPSTTQDEKQAEPSSVDHLLLPYVERLLALSRNQKAIISQKSYLNHALSKKTKEVYQNLGYLAEESQLLPAHPMKDSLRRRSGLMAELTSKKSDKPEVSNRIKPWVFASDSAKIANLESVAETLEGGQMALEASMNALQELESLLGLNKDEPEQAAEKHAENDFWFEPSTKDIEARKHTEVQKAPSRNPGDPWSVLHGNLGLIG